MFSLPTIVFLAGTSLAIGEWTRRPILVFVIPLALLMVDVFFLWSWSPGWLDPRINRAMMLIEPGGVRWLNETWLKVDRGVSFYNTAAIPLRPGVLDQPAGLRRSRPGSRVPEPEALREHAARTLVASLGTGEGDLAREPIDGNSSTSPWPRWEWPEPDRV